MALSTTCTGVSEINVKPALDYLTGSVHVVNWGLSWVVFRHFGCAAILVKTLESILFLKSVMNEAIKKV